MALAKGNIHDRDSFNLTHWAAATRASAPWALRSDAVAHGADLDVDSGKVIHRQRVASGFRNREDDPAQHPLGRRGTFTRIVGTRSRHGNRAAQASSFRVRQRPSRDGLRTRAPQAEAQARPWLSTTSEIPSGSATVVDLCNEPTCLQHCQIWLPTSRGQLKYQ